MLSEHMRYNNVALYRTEDFIEEFRNRARAFYSASYTYDPGIQYAGRYIPSGKFSTIEDAIAAVNKRLSK